MLPANGAPDVCSNQCAHVFLSVFQKCYGDMVASFGEGTTVFVEICLPSCSPGDAPSKPADSASLQLAPPAGAEPLQVLVVEDNDYNQDVLVEMIGLLGHAATMARNGPSRDSSSVCRLPHLLPAACLSWCSTHRSIV